MGYVVVAVGGEDSSLSIMYVSLLGSSLVFSRFGGGMLWLA